MARVYITGGGSPQFGVFRSSQTIPGVIPFDQIAFDLNWSGNGTLLYSGAKLKAAMSGTPATIFSFTDLGYVPASRVLGRFSYSNNLITNTTINQVVTYSDKITIDDLTNVVELFYFIFARRMS